MSSFTKAVFVPTGKTEQGRILWRTDESFEFDIGYVGSGLSVTVPAGFETDGPSIPWILLPIAKAGSMVRSSAVHDRLREDLRFAKTDGDAIFLTALMAEGVPTFRRWIAFIGVSLNNSRKVPK